MPGFAERLEDDDGVFGFVVSRAFQKMSSIDRQGKIDEALRNVLRSNTGTKASPLTKEKAIGILKNDPYIEVMANT